MKCLLVYTFVEHKGDQGIDPVKVPYFCNLRQSNL